MHFSNHFGEILTIIYISAPFYFLGVQLLDWSILTVGLWGLTKYILKYFFFLYFDWKLSIDLFQVHWFFFHLKFIVELI